MIRLISENAWCKRIGNLYPIRRIRDAILHREVCRLTKPLNLAPFFAEGIKNRSFKVIFISPWYKEFPTLVASLEQQTYPNWELLLIHDGSYPEIPPKYEQALSDTRIHLRHTAERANDWGHTPRRIGLQEVAEKQWGDFVVVTNSDNYYVPGFIEKMLESFVPETDVAFCDMAHNYYEWRPFSTRLKYSFIDCGCLMTKRELATTVGWRDVCYEADWTYVCDLLESAGKDRFRKVPAILFIHN